jgi:hypothetical protein
MKSVVENEKGEGGKEKEKRNDLRENAERCTSRERRAQVITSSPPKRKTQSLESDEVFVLLVFYFHRLIYFPPFFFFFFGRFDHEYEYTHMSIHTDGVMSTVVCVCCLFWFVTSFVRLGYHWVPLGTIQGITRWHFLCWFGSFFFFFFFAFPQLVRVLLTSSPGKSCIAILLVVIKHASPV